jgi:hypothetical protein
MYLSGWVSSDLFNPFGIVMFCDNKHLKKQCQYYLSAKNSTFDFSLPLLQQLYNWVEE